ncbi:MAG: response regulator [Anaerolineae bacterium]|nr:response regulator [Anaerolineae bacterium]
MYASHIIVAENQALLGVLIELTINQIYPKARVSTVMDGQAALQVYEQVGADLIIADKKVPIINGFELTRTLRAKGATVPIIVLSEDSHGENEAIEAGATLLMRKLGLSNLLPLVLFRLLPS